MLAVGVFLFFIVIGAIVGFKEEKNKRKSVTDFQNLLESIPGDKEVLININSNGGWQVGWKTKDAPHDLKGMANPRSQNDSEDYDVLLDGWDAWLGALIGAGAVQFISGRHPAIKILITIGSTISGYSFGKFLSTQYTYSYDLPEDWRIDLIDESIENQDPLIDPKTTAPEN